MSTYRLLNLRTGNYCRLDSLGDDVTVASALVDELTTRSEPAIHAAYANMSDRFPGVNYARLHSNGDLGDDWRALRNRHFYGVEGNGAASAAPTPRTWRVIITDSPDGECVGDYTVTADPVSGDPRTGQVDFLNLSSAEEAAERFRGLFGPDVTYRVVSRYGLTWEEIADNVRSDWEVDNARQCVAFTCGAPATDGDYCAGHAGNLPCDCPDCRPAPPRRRRNYRCELPECGTRQVHHDDIAEVFLCDHAARERIDAGYPVTTAYPVPA